MNKNRSADGSDLSRFPIENIHPVMRTDFNGRLLSHNRAAARFLEDKFGAIPENIGAAFPGFYEGLAEYIPGMNTILETGAKERIYEWHIVVIPEHQFVNIFGHDITAPRTVEANLARLLKEKEVLLKETHHSVKNNLMVISSLVGLQRHRIKDAVLKDCLTGISSRIHTLSLIYQLSYQSGSFSRIDLHRLLHDLVMQLSETYNVDGTRIRLEIGGRETPIDLAQAIPCGLMINEIVSNSMKFAFPAGRPGRITADLDSREGEIKMDLADDGIGIPKGLTPESADSLGLSLIPAFVEQLNGSYRLTRESGTRFRVSFPAGANRR
jgi:two-component sensor histidine kinase